MLGAMSILHYNTRILVGVLANQANYDIATPYCVSSLTFPNLVRIRLM